MASVWGELKRRNVVKVAVAYAIVGWLLVQVADTFFPALQLPEWTVTFVAGLVILGFPLALILSWAYELTPEGIKLERAVAAGESITHITGRKIDFAIIGALVLALGFVGYNYLLDDGEAAAGVLPNSVAVLPFDNMSANPEHAYFASGLHDEIINQLAKLKNLNVIARTSVMQYAGAARPITEIARELNVGTIMEGSVSYAEDRVAIRAQLIDAETGVHLWSDSYNRDFSDVFGIYADIAMNVANALEAEFSLAEQQAIEKAPTDSPAAYALYLKAADLKYDNMLLDATSLLDQAIGLDPNFAVAYARRARFRVLLSNTQADADTSSSFSELARQDARRALELNSNLGVAHLAEAETNRNEGRWLEAQRAYEHAAELKPSDPEVLLSYARLKGLLGDSDQALALTQRAVDLDPNNSHWLHRLGNEFLFAGKPDAALAVLRDSTNIEPTDVVAFIWLGFAQIADGRDDAEETLQIAERLARANSDEGVYAIQLAELAYAHSHIERPRDAQRLFEEVMSLSDDYSLGTAPLVLAYLAIGDADQALHYLQQAADTVTPDPEYNVWMLVKTNSLRDATLDRPQFSELRTQMTFYTNPSLAE